MRILIYDRQPLFDDALEQLLRTRCSARQVDCVDSPEQALDHLRSDPKVDLFIAAMDTDDAGDGDHLSALVRAAPSRPVLALASRVDLHRIKQVMRTGAMGLLSRYANADETVKACGKVLSGARYVPSDLMGVGEAGPAHQDDGPSGFDALTPRQREVLRLLSQGQSNQEIARALGIALATVKLHVNAVLRTLNVRNRTEAARLAITSGLAESSSADPLLPTHPSRQA